MITFPFHAIHAASMALLPPKMVSAPAEAMLIAIGLQESRFEHRRQIGGPARGFWQFEQGGGVRGVMEHPATAPIILPILDRLQYEPVVPVVYSALEHNDILACIFARLLLWTVPGPLPGPSDAHGAWEYYVEGWRPGKPHRQTWDDFYARAWQEVGS